MWRTRSEARLVHYHLLLRRLNLEIFKYINLKVKFVHFQNLERGWTELTRGEQGKPLREGNRRVGPLEGSHTAVFGRLTDLRTATLTSLVEATRVMLGYDW